MRKMIIIEEKSNRIINNKFIEWFIYTIGYALVLILVSCIFKNNFYINNSYYGVYAFFAAVIIYVLNQTIKPILFYITLPITALTFGVFYPIINVIILYMASFILGDNFVIRGWIAPFIIAIVISILNLFMEGLIIKPIIERKFR